jgi:hypothetical protein
MTKKIVRPILPVAPDQYDQVFVNQLARTLEQLIDEVRSADVNFQGISGSGATNILESGDFYVGEAGFIRIIEKTEIYSGSIQGTASVGTVTIATS